MLFLTFEILDFFMPELPEAETTVRELKNKLAGRTILKIWTDYEKMFRPSFAEFRKGATGRKIKIVSRRGKNIILEFHFGGGVLIHQKLTGSLLFNPAVETPFIHLIFFLDKGRLVLSDVRKFGKAVFTEDLAKLPDCQNLGIEPLSPEFTLKRFREILAGANGKIKKILTNQKKIAGLGNIYSDEILFAAKISPLRKVENLKENEIRNLFQTVKKILLKAVNAKGTGVSDYLRPSGKKGGFSEFLQVYGRKGKSCFRCGTKIKAVKFGGRTSCYCPKCQKQTPAVKAAGTR